MPSMLQNLVLAIPTLTGRKPVQKEGIAEKCGFFQSQVSSMAQKSENLHFTPLCIIRMPGTDY